MFTIVHITYAPITAINGYGLQIESCLRNGYDVKIIDISALYNLPKPVQIDKFVGITKSLNILSELDHFIQGLDSKKSLINIQIGYEWRFREIFKLVAKYKNYQFSIFLFGQLPFRADKTFFQRLLTVSLFSLPKKTLIKIIEKIYFKTGLLALPKNNFYAGEKLKPDTAIFQAFPINYFDYDYYLQDKEASDDHFILFLDDGMFQHPDDAIVGNKIHDNLINDYRFSLNNFFDVIEKKTNMKVVISGHPKINYPANFFGDRQIIKYKTPELVKKCNFALCHYSSSLSLAVCYEKPILFIYNKCIDEFSKKNQPIKEYISSLAAHLKQPIINIDTPSSFDSVEHLAIDKKVYKQFEIDYLTTEKTKNKKTEDIFMDYIARLLN